VLEGLVDVLHVLPVILESLIALHLFIDLNETLSPLLYFIQHIRLLSNIVVLMLAKEGTV
jgi:hypothetical protein